MRGEELCPLGTAQSPESVAAGERGKGQWGGGREEGESQTMGRGRAQHSTAGPWGDGVDRGLLKRHTGGGDSTGEIEATHRC